MKKHSILIAALVATLSFVIARSSFAHAGHDKAPGEEGETTAKGPITITAEAKANLGLKVEEAELRTIEKTLTAIGAIEAVPTRSAVVSSTSPDVLPASRLSPGTKCKKVRRLLKWRVGKSATRRRA